MYMLDFNYFFAKNRVQYIGRENRGREWSANFFSSKIFNKVPFKKLLRWNLKSKS